MFSKFERLASWRYLRAKRKEGFISVITGFAFTGIALGVATLIIVMSVMNGFKAELLNRILGINGHISIVASAGFPFNNYKKAVKDLESIKGIELALPLIEKQLLVSSSRGAEGAMVRGIEKEDIGIIDIQENVTYIDILNGKGWSVIDGLKTKTIKGKKLKVQKAYN